MRKGAARLLAVLAISAVVLCGLAAWFGRTEGHWSVDSAVWELMTREVARRGWEGLWVTNLAQAADPEGRFFPSFFFVRRGDRYHFAFQPAFALLSAPAYRALGKAGLAAVPTLAALILAWVVARGTERVLPGMGWAGAAVILFLTPIPLYAVTVWNHLPSVALLTAGALLAWASGLGPSFRPIGMAAAGLCVGLGLLFRNEAYVYAAGLALAWLTAAPRHRWTGAALFAVGFAAGWLVQAGFNWHLFGSLFGPKAEAVAARQATGGWDLSYRLWNVYLFLAAPDFAAFLRGGTDRGLLLFSAVLFAVVTLLLPSLESRSRLSAASLYVLAGAETVVLTGRTQVTGFFWVAPFLVLAFVNRPLTPARRFLWSLGLLFAAGVTWTASHGGFQWGPRYLLAVYPVAVWLAADGWAALPPRVREAVRRPATLLLFLALLAQAAGVDHADQGQWRATQALRTIRSLPTDYVVVGLEIFAWDFAPAYGEKVLMSVESQAELEEAVRGLLRAGVEWFTYIPRSGVAFDRTVVERVHVAGKAYRVVQDRTTAGIRLVQYRLVRTGRPE